MSGIPVVITDKYGIPVRQVTSGAPLMTVATNGRGIPIVLSNRGMAFVVEGANPVVPAAFTAGQWSVTPTNTAINVTINSLPYNGGSAITAVQYRLNGGSWVSSGGTGSFTISSLTNGTTYTVELRAVNAIGNGLDSDDKTATPATVPSAPTLAVTPADGQVTVAWTDGATGGSTITARRLYRSTTSGFTPGSGNLIATSPTFPYVDTAVTNDTAYYYKGIAANIMGDSAASTQQSATPSDVTPLPAAGDLAFHFSAGDITPVADGTDLTTWPDHVAGISMTQATAGLRPKYRTARVNGLPAVQFEGGQVLPMGRPAALLDALARYNDTTGVTMFFVMANIDPAAGDFNSFWSPSGINNDRTMIISGSLCGTRGDRRAAPTSGLQIVVARRSSVISNEKAQFFHNGNGFAAGDLSPDPSANYVLGGDINDEGWTLKGDMLEVGCYNKALTAADVYRLIKHFCDKYGAAYPWAAADHFVVFDGDSQTAGYDDNWPSVMMAAKAQPFFAYTNFAFSGRFSSAMAASVSVNYTDLAEVIGKPILVNGFEFYNQQESDAAGIKAYAAAVRVAQPDAKIGLGTSIDYGGSDGPERAAFNAAVAASTVSYDVLVPIHTASGIGPDGSCPAPPGPYGPNFEDNIHLNATGNAILAAFWGPYYDTLVASISPPDPGAKVQMARNDALSRTEITNTADFPGGTTWGFVTDAGADIVGVTTPYINDSSVPTGRLYKGRANGDAATDSALHAIERDDNIFRINFADEADGALNGEQSIVAPASYQIISGALTVDAGEQSFFCDLGVTDQSVTLEPYYRVGSNDLDSPSTARAIRLCASSAGTTYLEAQIKGNKVQFTKRTPGGGWEGFWPLIELPFGQDFDDKAFRCQVVWDGGLPYFAIFNDDVRLDTAGGLGINANADPAQTNITQQTGMGFSGPEGTGSANPSYPIKVLKTISADNVVDVGIVVATVEFTEPTDTVPPSIEFNGTTDYAAIQAVVVAIDGRELGDINSFTGLTPGAMSLIIPSPPEGMGQAAFLRVRQTSNPSNYTDYRLGVLPVYAPVEPLYIGSQSAGLAPFGVNDFMRNRVDQGNWIWRGGASNNENATLNAQGFPVGPMPSGATGLAIKLWEGIYIYEGVRDGAFRVEYLNGSPSDFRAIPGLSNIAASAKDATGMTLTLSMAGPTNYYSGSVEFDLTAIPADGFQVTCIPVGDTGSSTDILAAEATEVWNSDVLPKMPWRDMKDSGAENATGVPKFPTAAGKVNFAIDFVDKTGCESYYHVLNWGDVADRLETVPRAWVESFNSSLLTSASILALEVGNEVWNDFYLAQMLSMGARATTVEGCYDEGVVPEGATAYYAFDKVNYGAEAPDGGKTTATFEPGDVFTCMSLYTRLLVECIATVTVPIGTAVPNSGENAYFRVLASGLEITTAARRYQSHLQAQAGILGKSIMGDRCKSILGIFVLDTVDTVCDLLEFNDAYLNIDHFSPSFYAGGKVEYASTWWAALYASDFATFKSEYYALRRATTDDIISKLVVLKHGVVEEMINRGHNIADIPTMGHLYEGLDHNVIGNIPDADRAGVMAAMDACHKSAEEGIETAYMFSEIKEKIGGTIYTFADVSPLIYNGSADNGILQQWGLRTRQYDGTWNSNGADELRYNAAVAIMAA